MATDFSMKPNVDISGIAGILQKKAQMQAELDQQASDTKMRMIQQAITGATQTVSGMVQAAKDKQKADFVKSLGDSLAAQVPKQNVTLPQAGPMLPDYNNILPSSPVAGNVGDRTSQFPGAPGQAGTSQPGMQPLPDVQTQVPDYNKMNAIKAAVSLDPKSAADNLMKSANPSSASAYEYKTNDQGQLVRVNKLNPADTQVVPGFQSNAITSAQRGQQMDINQQNADTRGQNANTNQSRFVTVTGDKLANAVDPTKLRDYDRLTAGKRLDVFVQATQGKAIKQQVVEASSLLASMLQGGGRGGVVSEKLIEQLTPSTLKGSAMEKLQWLTNNTQSVDQQKFLDLFEQTAKREATAGEDNIRQQQVEALKKYEKVKRLDPQRYKEIQQSIGLSDDNIDPKGRFLRTATTRSVLPNYNDQTGANAPVTGVQLQAAMQRIAELRAKQGQQ